MDILNLNDEILQGIREEKEDSILHLYLAKTVLLIQKYEHVPQNDSEKQNIIKQYIDVAKPYIQKYCKETIQLENNTSNTNCKECGNDKDFEYDDDENICICLKCFSQKKLFSSSSYNYVERTNARYSYERKNPFRECLKQFQGKQNSVIPQKVYDDLEEQFELNHLLVGDESTSKHERFKNITKQHVLMFLKNPLKYMKHYKDVHLIHYELTGIPPMNLSHIEDKLVDDYERLVQKYNEKNIVRKNYINMHYVLYQLLRKHNIPCKREDFPDLTTPDKTYFHYEICRELFSELDWEHYSYY